MKTQSIQIDHFNDGSVFIFCPPSIRPSVILKELNEILLQVKIDQPPQISIQITSAMEKQIVPFLNEQKFTLQETEIVVTKNLIGIPEVSVTPSKNIQFESYRQTGLAPFLKIGMALGNISEMDSEEAFQKKQNESFNPDAWFLAKDEDGIAIGFFLAEVTQTRKGILRFLAVDPDQQGKGYGQFIHRKALLTLQRLGATHYEGRTSSENLSMLKIFEKNKCLQTFSNLIYSKKY